MLDEKYTIFMYIYDEYKRFDKIFSSVNDFLMRARIRDIIEFYKLNYNQLHLSNQVHYQYYKEFTTNTIDIIQSFLPSNYVPPYRLLLCKSGYDNYGVHRYGWKAVIQSFLITNYTEDCFHDNFYYENPSFEWTAYANIHSLDTYEETIQHYSNNHTISESYDKMPFIIFDDWIEVTFPNLAIIPLKKYKYPFLSFIHNPPCINTKDISTTIYKNKDVFCNEELMNVRSHLKILISLSEFHTAYLKELHGGYKHYTLYHPLQCNLLHTFDLNEFIKSSHKFIFNIGWWLRKYDTFLRVKNYEKIIVIKSVEGPHIEKHIYNEIGKTIHLDNQEFTESDMMKLNTEYNTQIVHNLKNDEYDAIFKKNIVFLELYDTTANNIVLECIMHNTPLLVNNLPSTVEYLGIDYPFYFTNLLDAQTKLDSVSLIIDTHKYLKNMNKQRFTYDYFNKQLKNIIHENIRDSSSNQRNT
jgi:hypothetical protein